ncbi:MAG: hypothetical protein L3J63_10835, partial [Geopsychrobacter sp.]|nr:hypothetical protein [Geopsychrobacter sp.]
ALIPGNEGLVAKLAAEGKTTGGEAAQAVLAAENKLRQTAMANIKADAPDAPPATEAGEESTEAKKDQENVAGLVAGMSNVKTI